MTPLDPPMTDAELELVDGWDDEEPEQTSTRLVATVICADSVPTNPGVLVTAAEAQARYGIPADRIRRWKDRDRLAVKGYRDGAPLFSPPDVRRLNRQAEQDTRALVA